MKRLLLILFLSISQITSYAQAPEFSGEELNYRISFSIFSIGKASVTVEDLPSSGTTEDQYKVTAKGVTTGLVGVFSKINDEWGAHVHKDDLTPKFSYRRIREGKYKRDEDVDFDSASITLNEWSFRAGKYKDPVIYQTSGTVYELLSGMLYVRSLDFTKYKYDDIIRFKAFFEGEFYDFEVMFKGKEKVKTKLGKINAIKLVPIMPDNSLFDGENSISIWISDDRNKIPLKIEADMFIGSAGCDITDVKNLKYPINRS